MDFLIEKSLQLVDLVFHIDQHLSEWSLAYGPWIYGIVFVIVFAETGLVVTPFLPGDSLLFALGAMTTFNEGALSLPWLSAILILAAFLGDNLNYFFGKHVGPKVFASEHSRIFNRKYLMQTQQFYEKYGTHAIIIARFVPIVRTFTPFVAGVGRMPYSKYITFSLVGSVLWTQIFLWAGHVFGNLPQVKSNFHIVIFAVIGLSVMPIVVGWWRAKRSTVKTV